MIILPITLTAAGAAGLINIWLAMRCGRVRTSQKISIGDGGNEELVAAMRAQANFVEYTPFVLVLLAVIELAWGSPMWLWIVSGVYLLGRVGHGLGMTGTFKQGRMIGTLTTMLTLLILAVVAITIPYMTVSTIQLHEIRAS